MLVKSVFLMHKCQFIGKMKAYEQSNFHLQTIQFLGGYSFSISAPIYFLGMIKDSTV